MRYKVYYSTMNDRYEKRFKTIEEAEEFCDMIHHLYPEQRPIPEVV